jgi:hypothetical protein
MTVTQKLGYMYSVSVGIHDLIYKHAFVKLHVIAAKHLISYEVKGTVQRKVIGVLSGINRKLMISSIAARYFLKKF